MTRLFGTDGVRGVANSDLTPELAYKLGFAAAHVLTEKGNRKPRIVVGEDTRISCGMLGSSLIAGITSAGADAIAVGVVPTPGAAYLSRFYGADATAVISASHNSFEYNGIKFFRGDGYKLPDAVEDLIEAEIKNYEVIRKERPIKAHVGRRIEAPEGARCYLLHLYEIAGIDLKGYRIALDCANGASSNIAPELFGMMGADVVVMGANPDGININLNCGSTHLDRLREMVVREHCDLGLAFDGDADRMLSVDADGTVHDGDTIMAILAKDLKDRGKLRGDVIVATVMSNLGLEIMARQNGMKLLRTKVGDRYVLEEMKLHNYSVGGEQSGHLILLDDTTTGDGMLSALKLLAALKRSGKTLKEAASIIKICPQVLKNVHIENTRKTEIMENSRLRDACADVENKLRGAGRVLVRASGTEPLIRVMLEGTDLTELNEYAESIASLILEL